jgi:GDPmannose 4,6-dehydratase
MERKPKKVLITGITGQDGSYMAEYCLELGHQVFGMVRRISSPNNKNYAHLIDNPNFTEVKGDLSDSSSINNLVEALKPDYFINFAAQSFVKVSWDIPEETFDVGAVGVLRCLEAIRKHNPNCRFYNAGSSEEFGNVDYSPQDEKHPLKPRSPYGAAKCAARHLVKVYRESYNLYAIQGYLFNHESERRGEEFVTRKITQGVARIYKAIKEGKTFKPIELGNINAKRDWSHAQDFMDGVWRMLNQEEYRTDIKYSSKVQTEEERRIDISRQLKEYVLSSNETHEIREFVGAAFYAAGLSGGWLKEGEDDTQERFIIPYLRQPNPKKIDGMTLVVINKDFYRPNEVEILMGDSSLARSELKWEPKIGFEKLVARMVSSDLKAIE